MPRFRRAPRLVLTFFLPDDYGVTAEWLGGFLAPVFSLEVPIEHAAQDLLLGETIACQLETNLLARRTEALQVVIVGLGRNKQFRLFHCPSRKSAAIALRSR
jgi:hypothetical protein